MEDIVIVAAARTAVGKFGGTLAKTPATELGSIVIKAVLERTGLPNDAIGEVIMGQVLAAGVGQNPARQAMMKAGVAKETPALTINAVCGSGLKAVMLAAQAINAGDSEIVIAGGQENMSASPHVLNGSRDGQRMGDWKMTDTMIVDGLWDVYNQYHMGITAENVAKAHGISRAQQDECGESAGRTGSFTEPLGPGSDGEPQGQNDPGGQQQCHDSGQLPIDDMDRNRVLVGREADDMCCRVRHGPPRWLWLDTRIAQRLPDR